MAAGQCPALFWSLTPREIDNVMTGAGERARIDHNNRAWQAWQTANLTRAEKLPPLADLMAGERRRSGKQSWQDMLAALKSHAVLYNKLGKRSD